MYMLISFMVCDPAGHSLCISAVQSKPEDLDSSNKAWGVIGVGIG